MNEGKDFKSVSKKFEIFLINFNNKTLHPFLKIEIPALQNFNEFY